MGKVRVGVAVSDPDGMVATPLETLARDLSKTVATPSDVARLAEIVVEYDIVEIVIGLPVTLRGDESFAAEEARGYAATVGKAAAAVPISFIDERLTTAAASRKLSERGIRGKRRRAVVDQAAAVEILQQWLEQQRKA